ncbi:MAG: hypothetical protein ACI4AE_01245 [Candidatus Cryptobacteroides sp.]
MEFDSSIRLRTLSRIDMETSLDGEAFGQTIWDIAAASSRNVGQGGPGEIWIDHSDRLRTRHLVVGFEKTGSSGGINTYHVTVSAGRRQSTLADVIVGFLVIAAFWLCSRIMQGGQYSALYICGACLCLAGAAVLAVYGGKDFGEEEAAAIEKAIKEIR